MLDTNTNAKVGGMGMTVKFICFLVEHGIDPKAPLILGGVIMGLCLAVLYNELKGG